MNYRHAYHAGNFADVLKHTVLALLIEALKRKPTPFFYLDTHAGPGLYDLASVEAEKTGEWKGGIGRLRARTDPLPAAFAPYLEALAAFDQGEGRDVYPGSPAIVAALARPTDRMAFCELHPEDCTLLRRSFVGDTRVGVHHREGYEALSALLPPPERRGLVLIDPPFENKDEFIHLRQGLSAALKRWPTGMYALWYPIKDHGTVARFLADVAMLGAEKRLVAELLLDHAQDSFRLHGCGLVVINPPWQLDETLKQVLPWLAPPGGGYRLL